MKKKHIKIITVATCCLAFSLAGCSKQQSTEPTTTPVETTTEAPTTTPAETTTEAPTTTPAETTTEAPTTTPAETTTKFTNTVLTDDSTELNISDILKDLQTAGVIAKNPDTVTAAPAPTDTNVAIEKVESYANSFVIVTLNAKLDKTDVNDIALKRYSDNWYSLKPSTTNMKISETLVTVNDQGKTVIIYNTEDKMDGTIAVTDTSKKRFDSLEKAITTADNYLSWQMSHGGWDKGVEDQAKAPAKERERKNKFSGWTAKDGSELGTIDNDATYTQMRHIAAVYRETGDAKYKESVLKGLDFIFLLQTESGGFTQVYPKRGNYSDNVTFNDNAMINVLIMLEDMRARRYPFDSDILSDEDITKIDASINKAIDFILKSQIETNGKLTAWCAQHDPVTYAPVGARAYELPSISGSESVPVVKFLMNQEQTPEIKNAVECAIQWFRDSEVKNTKYIRKDPNAIHFVEEQGSSIWYRFYDIETNLPIFCDRDGVKRHNISEVGEERRFGYSWANTAPQKLLEIYDSCGYYNGRIEAVVADTKSTTADGKTLAKDSICRLETEITIK